MFEFAKDLAVLSRLHELHALVLSSKYMFFIHLKNYTLRNIFVPINRIVMIILFGDVSYLTAVKHNLITFT
jgi:hypothetical protein